MITPTDTDPGALGLDAVTEADIRRTLAGRGKGFGANCTHMNRNKLRRRLEREAEAIERVLRDGPAELARLRAWLKRKERA